MVASIGVKWGVEIHRFLAESDDDDLGMVVVEVVELKVCSVRDPCRCQT